MTFRGWPDTAFRFYEGLEADNSRAYFLANKGIYDSDVKAPLLALSELVEKEFGPLRLFRPNRDTRFAKDKSPYKTNAAAVTEGEGGTHFYVSISTEGLYAGSGYYGFASDQLERYRAAVAGKAGASFAAALAQIKKPYEVGARESLKRVPRGFDADHPRAELLKYKGIHIGRQFAPAKWMSTAGAAAKITETWRAAKSVNRWLDKHVGPTTEAPW